MGQGVGAMAGTGRRGGGGRGAGPRAGALGRDHPCRWVRDIVCRSPATLRSFWGFKVLNHPTTLMVTEPWWIQVAWWRSMSWCKALLMVTHVRRWVVSSGVGHPVSMRGILAFARAEFMMLRGGGVPRGFNSLAVYSPPVGGLVPGRVRVPDGGW